MFAGIKAGPSLALGVFHVSVAFLHGSGWAPMKGRGTQARWRLWSPCSPEDRDVPAPACPPGGHGARRQHMALHRGREAVPVHLDGRGGTSPLAPPLRDRPPLGPRAFPPAPAYPPAARSRVLARHGEELHCDPPGWPGPPPLRPRGPNAASPQAVGRAPPCRACSPLSGMFHSHSKSPLGKEMGSSFRPTERGWCGAPSRHFRGPSLFPESTGTWQRLGRPPEGQRGAGSLLPLRGPSGVSKGLQPGPWEEQGEDGVAGRGRQL